MAIFICSSNFFYSFCDAVFHSQVSRSPNLRAKQSICEQGLDLMRAEMLTCSSRVLLLFYRICVGLLFHKLNLSA
jgi:hypothetical protein